MGAGGDALMGNCTFGLLLLHLASRRYQKADCEVAVNSVPLDPSLTLCNSSAFHLVFFLPLKQLIRRFTPFSSGFATTGAFALHRFDTTAASGEKPPETSRLVRQAGRNRTN